MNLFSQILIGKTNYSSLTIQSGRSLIIQKILQQDGIPDKNLILTDTPDHFLAHFQLMFFW